MSPPDRWDAYQPMGSVIPGTKFIAFKVPLKQELCHNLPENECFSPEHLVQSLKDSGKNLGLVVDLTFTRKYYNGEVSFARNSIQYEKIFTKGHEVPSDDVFQRFLEVVDDYTSQNRDEDAVIGVHCTHGINRTGYLVCRYMIEKLKMEPEEAISLFGKARGHKIERENYINDLKTRPRPISSGQEGYPAGGNDWRGPRRDRGFSGYSRDQGNRQQQHWGQPWRGGPSDRRDLHTGHREGPALDAQGYPSFQGPDWGQGYNHHRQGHPADTAAAPLPGYQGQGRGGRWQGGGHRSPLDGDSQGSSRWDQQQSGGWGDAARRSGWGSSSSSSQARGWGNNAYSGHNQQAGAGGYQSSQRSGGGGGYSWRRPEEGSGGSHRHGGSGSHGYSGSGSHGHSGSGSHGCSGSHGHGYRDREEHRSSGSGHRQNFADSRKGGDREEGRQRSSGGAGGEGRSTGHSSNGQAS